MKKDDEERSTRPRLRRSDAPTPHLFIANAWDPSRKHLGTSLAADGDEAFTTCSVSGTQSLEAEVAALTVGRCKLDPGLKAPGFKIST